jgi:hypothetical protein
MTLSRSVRRVILTTHLVSSLGWLGAALVFVALATIGLTSRHDATVRGAYLVMAPSAWFVLVPTAHASLVSGILLSVGTAWGLFRHYWVLAKLGITVFATVVLLVYMDTFRAMAAIAADPVVGLHAVRNASPLVHGSIAVGLLTIATVLGVYKPFGVTPFAVGVVSDPGSRPRWPSRPNVLGTTDFAPRGRLIVAAFGAAALLALLLLHRIAGGHVGH